MKQLTKKELEILTYLRSNGRHTVTQIGKKLDVPRTTVFDKIKKFRKLRLITRFAAIINFNQLGGDICAYVMFKTDVSKKEELGNALAASGHTNNVLKLGNEYDFLASLVFENMMDMHAYLDIISKKYEIKDVKILYIASELKREGFMAKYESDSKTVETSEE